MRKVDKFGRIVIPMELRQKYGLFEGASIEFLDSGDGITVKSSAPTCKLCGKAISADASIPLCEKCICDVRETAR